MAEGHYPSLETQVDTTLGDLDFDDIRHERFERNRHFLEGVSPAIASKVFPGHEDDGKLYDVRELAAITLQKYWRGYLGRQLYVTALWNKFEQEEERQRERVRYQMEEGELLVENHQLEVLLDDGRTTRRNATRRYLSKIITIQRAWRSYLDKVRTSQHSSYHGDVKQDVLTEPVCSHEKRSNPFDNNTSSISDDKSNNKLDNRFTDTEFETDCVINPLCTVPVSGGVDEPLTEQITLKAESSAVKCVPISDNIDDNSSAEQNALNLESPEFSTVNRVNSNHLSPRQQRKHSLLSQAKQFVELKKLDANVLPFNLHMHLDSSEGTIELPTSCVEQTSSMSEVMSPTSVNPDIGLGRKQGWGEEMSTAHMSGTESSGNCVNSKPCVGVKSGGDKSDMDLKQNGGYSVSCDTNSHTESQKTSCDINTYSASDTSETKGSNPGKTSESKGSNSDAISDSRGSNSDITQEDAFDVYNIETTLPDMDWNSLEQKLKAASLEAKKIQEARRNDREEIRKKLAFGAEDDDIDDDDDDEEVTYNKPNIQSRLQSGLQICFMNESPGDTDNEGMSPRQHEFHDNAKLLKKVSSLVDSDNNLSTVTDLNNPTASTTSVQSTSPPRLKADGEEKAEDFHSRQEQLQNEAKMALAQAGSMAHMQLEIEKQTKKKSPMAEMVGIPGLGDRHRKKLSIRQLQQMNLASIQVLYNDLQTQIENLNEELVHLLMERDELHMEQDSMLVDIEDLTRRAEELAERANRTGGNKGNKTSTGKGKLPAR